MESKSDVWSLLSFKEYETDINPIPTYQRSSVWKPAQKQMLIDSIIRRIDIPKIYLRQLNNSKYKYEIIDGQQRMRTIWDFLNNNLQLSDYSEALIIDGKKYEISGKQYKELNDEIKRERIHKFNLNVVTILNADETEIADLFYRLNNGTPLTPAEIRNAKLGEMRQRIKDLSNHPFFNKVSFSNKRFSHDQVCAQMMLLELEGGIADIQDKYLSKMYNEYKKSVPKKFVDNVKKSLDVMDKLFPVKSRFLNRASTINIYLLISYLLKTAKLGDKFYSDFFNWYVKTEVKRRRNNEYKLYMTKSANARQSIEGRFKILLLDFYKKFNDMELISLDPRRIFTEKQKMQIFARDKGLCKIDGKKVTERTWHADHIIPWIKGGKTEISNAQILCVKHNLQKKDKLW